MIRYSRLDSQLVIWWGSFPVNYRKGMDLQSGYKVLVLYSEEVLVVVLWGVWGLWCEEENYIETLVNHGN